MKVFLFSGILIVVCGLAIGAVTDSSFLGAGFIIGAGYLFSRILG